MTVRATIIKQLTPDAAVRDEDEVVLGLVVGGTHVVYLGVHADLLAAVKDLRGETSTLVK